MSYQKIIFGIILFFVTSYGHSKKKNWISYVKTSRVKRIFSCHKKPLTLSISSMKRLYSNSLNQKELGPLLKDERFNLLTLKRHFSQFVALTREEGINKIKDDFRKLIKVLVRYNFYVRKYWSLPRNDQSISFTSDFLMSFTCLFCSCSDGLEDLQHLVNFTEQVNYQIVQTLESRHQYLYITLCAAIQLAKKI